MDGFVVLTFYLQEDTMFRRANNCTIELLYLCGQNLPKILKKEFIFSKVAGLQTATLLKNKLHHKYFSRTLTVDEGQLFCRYTRVAASVANRNTKENEQ